MSNLKLDASRQYYPTPIDLATKMVNSISDWRYIETILEPSAGTGNIVEVLAKKEHILYGNRFDIDLIEIQPELRAILKEKFSNDNNYLLSKEEKERKFANEPSIVGDDFLSFSSYKHYDLIIMNPPFNDGASHLLKALDMQKNGGTIVCLLNAETIKNPFSNERKQLVRLLQKYNADVEYIENAFINSDNSTAVEVALIKVFIPTKSKTDSEILKSLEKGEKVPDFDFKECSLDVTDFIKSAINKFKYEVKVGLELLKEYELLRPYLMDSFTSKYSKPIIELKDIKPNEYIEKVRCKYWRALLYSPKFIGKMPSNLRDKYSNEVSKLGKYDFSEFNINNLSVEMASKYKEFIEERLIELFDEFTREHTWYEGCKDTTHFYNGWKTNKAHKISKKVILTCYDVYRDYLQQFDNYHIIEELDDIIKGLNYLNNESSNVYSSRNAIDNAIDNSENKNVDCGYFYVSFFKKGTMHLVFKEEYMPIIDRLNIFAGQKKNWLPPSYGKVTYENMNEDEKSVIDSFQGKEEYNKILQNSNYYLAPVCADSSLLLLEG